MPRYFFTFSMGVFKSAGRDREGSVFSDASEARKEAIGLAKDIAQHALHGRADWKSSLRTTTGASVDRPIVRGPHSQVLIWLKLLGRAVSRHALTVVWLTADVDDRASPVVTMVLLRDMPGAGTGAAIKRHRPQWTALLSPCASFARRGDGPCGVS